MKSFVCILSFPCEIDAKCIAGFFFHGKKSGRSVFQASSSHNHALLFLQSEEPKLAAAAISTKTGTLFNNSVHDEFIKAHHGCSKQDSDICELLYAKTCGKNSGITTLPWSSYALILHTRKIMHQKIMCQKCLSVPDLTLQ